jgi:hypothetical protein
MCTNISTFPQRAQASVGVGQPSASHEQEGTGEEEEVICE